MELPTLKDYDLEDKKVLLRVDINSPIDPEAVKYWTRSDSNVTSPQ